MDMVGTVAVGAIHILLTSFDPFGGSAVNNSQPIVKLLAAQASSMGANVVVSTCNLPVVYDQGAEVAMQCVEQNKPDIVVSFGEAECSLRIETAATNLDNTPDLADNAGQVRVNTPILSDGPTRSGFMFPVQAMYCALTKESPSVEVSVSPAAFICNNTAYHLSQELTAKGIPFSFIHVPNSRCSAEQANPATNAAAITQMLRGAISSLRRHPENQTTLPTNQAEAEALLQQWQKQNAPACELNFVQKMISAYEAGSSN